MKVVFRPEAEQDLNNLFDYLRGEAGARIAGEYVRRVHGACLSLSDLPNRGAPCPALGLGVRVLGFERRVVIGYRVEADAVEILAIHYGGRDSRPFAKE